MNKWQGNMIPTASAKKRLENTAGELADVNYQAEEDSQSRATSITKKLQLYKKRNLQSSLAIRGSADKAAPRPVSPGTVLNPKQGQQPVVQDSRSPVRVVYRKNRTEQRPVLLHSSTFRAQSDSDNPKFAHTLQNVEKIWVARRAQEAEERLQQQDFADTVTMWSYNQARIEEEMNRRQESYQMSSQTGRQCHKILRRGPAEEEEEAPGLGGAAGSRAATAHASLPALPGGRGGGHGGHSPMAARPTTAASDLNKSAVLLAPSFRPGSSISQDISLDPSDGAASQMASRPTTGISLSPYDNYDVADKAPMRLLLPLPPQQLATPDMDGAGSPTAAGAAAPASPEHTSRSSLKGLVPTHPSALRSTSMLNTTLDVVSTPQTVFAPSMTAAVGAPPPPAAAEAAPADAKKAPPKKPGGKKGKGGKKNKWKGPVHAGMLDQIFPTLPVEQEVPSLLRMQQMQQVESIREAFARQGLALPTSVIANGILTPEDRPYMECLTNLPSPEMGLVSDFTKVAHKKKGRKKGK